MKYIKLVTFALACVSLAACGFEEKPQIKAETETALKYNVVCYRNNDTELFNENVYKVYFGSQNAVASIYKTKKDYDETGAIQIANAICTITPL